MVTLPSVMNKLSTKKKEKFRAYCKESFIYMSRYFFIFFHDIKNQ